MIAMTMSHIRFVVMVLIQSREQGSYISNIVQQAQCCVAVSEENGVTHGLAISSCYSSEYTIDPAKADRSSGGWVAWILVRFWISF